MTNAMTTVDRALATFVYSLDNVLMYLALYRAERAVLAGWGRNQSPAFEARR